MCLIKLQMTDDKSENAETEQFQASVRGCIGFSSSATFHALRGNDCKRRSFDVPHLNQITP